MFEKAIYGSKKYYAWVGFLLVLIGIGALLYLWQLREGLGQKWRIKNSE